MDLVSLYVMNSMDRRGHLPLRPSLSRPTAPLRKGATDGWKFLLAVIIAMTVFLPGCSDSTGDRQSSRAARQELTPRERGEMRARWHIEKGKLRILIYGNPLSRRNPKIDEESGLPVRILIDCCVSPEAREETDAYNRVMRETVQERQSGTVTKGEGREEGHAPEASQKGKGPKVNDPLEQ
jgi:hypothetical protein